MQTIERPPEFSHDRRRFLGVAALSLAAMQLGPIGPAKAQGGPADPARPAAIKPGTNTSFAALKQVDAGTLNVGYAEAGPADGPPVLLLHGWPYDIHSYVDVAPILAAAGYRVIVPYLRGYGTTRFLSADTIRNGQQSVVAVDAIALMNALRIEKAVIGGFDWGARTANIMAALWPERIDALVSVSGYLIGNQEAGKQPLPPQAELQWWYQYYFATDRGRAGYGKYRRTLRSSSGSSRRQHGSSTTPRSIAVRRPSTIPITSPSWSITTAGVWVWPPARRAMTISRRSLPRRPSSPCRRSPSKVTPMARRIRIPRPTPRNSRARTRTG